MHEMDPNPLWVERKTIPALLFENTLDSISVVMIFGNTVLLLFF